MKTATIKQLPYEEIVPDGTVNPWLLSDETVVIDLAAKKYGRKTFWENAGMKLKAAYVAVKNSAGDTFTHCQMILHHPGGAVAVMVTEDFAKFGVIREDPRIQGVFVGAIRGFSDATTFGVESDVETLLRELNEETGYNAKHFILLASEINVDNALIVHAPGRGVSYYLVVVPNEELELVNGDLKLKAAAANKKTKDVVFEDVSSFNPLENYGFGLDGFLVTGWFLFQDWLSKNHQPTPKQLAKKLYELLPQ